MAVNEESGQAGGSARGGEGVSRRQLLRTAMWGSLGAFAAQGGVGTLAFLWPRKVSGFGGKIVAGNVDDFKVGTVTKFAEGKFYLVRLPEGFMALYWKCPHLGCTVPWAPPEDPTHFHCPCHGSTYDPTGQKVAGPAPRSMDMMAVEIVDGKVVVDTGKITQRLNHKPEHVKKV